MQLYRLDSIKHYYVIKGDEVFTYLNGSCEWVKLPHANPAGVRQLLTLIGNNFKPRGL